MSRPIWQVNLIKKGFPTPFMAALTRFPLIGKLVQRILFHKDDIYYLPINQSIKPDDQSTALPSDVLKYFAETASHRWIMNECICRSASNCSHYPIDLGCLFLGEAVLGINPALGRLVSVKDAHEFIDRCAEAGLVHLVGRNRLDAVWLNVKPGEKLLTICNCCECCCLWKVLLPHAYKPISHSVHRLEGLEVKTTEKCKGCESCIDVCFTKAISIENGRAVISDECRGCGRCVITCPEGAVEIILPDREQLNRALIDHISTLVEV